MNEKKGPFPIQAISDPILGAAHLLQKAGRVSCLHQECSGVSCIGRQRLDPVDDLTGYLGGAIEELLAKMATAAPARELKLNHRSITGWISGSKRDGQIQFESTLERDFAYLAFFDRRVFELQAQPFTLKYDLPTGHSSIYTPDFQLRYLQGPSVAKTAVVEVKYQEELEQKYDELVPRFDAMKNWCANNDAEFHIVTDKEIRGTRIDNVKALYPFVLAEGEIGELSAQIVNFVTGNEPVSIEDILGQNSDRRDEKARVQHTLWGLIANGTLWINLGESLTLATLVHSKPVSETHGLFFSRTSF